MFAKTLFPSAARPSVLQKKAVRAFGNFEQVYPVPPRYFLVKYELD